MRFAPSLPRRLPARTVDAGLALALFGVGQAEAWAGLDSSLGKSSNAQAAALAAVMTLPLAFRRTAPVAVAALVAVPTPIVAAAVPVRLVFFGGFVPLLIVTYTIASRARTPRSLLALCIPFGVLTAVELEVPQFGDAGEVVFDWIWFAVTATIGLIVRSRSLRADHSESRVVVLERERQNVLREERAQIARELHDVIAHSVSVIVVQAGAAEPLVDEDPEQVREALRSIRSTASDALGEMRRLLGILRTAGDELALTPQPSIAELDRLVEQVRAGGLEVELRVEGELRPLAPGLDLAAYRIVQEALTNARKHGNASNATVALRYAPSLLEVEVRDDGSAVTSTAGDGHGLVGMRERVGLYKGTLEAGARDDGGFAVRAVLPT